MKIKLKRNISTGLAVRTTLKAGEDYVPCGVKNCSRPERREKPVDPILPYAT